MHSATLPPRCCCCSCTVQRCREESGCREVEKIYPHENENFSLADEERGGGGGEESGSERERGGQSVGVCVWVRERECQAKLQR